VGSGFWGGAVKECVVTDDFPAPRISGNELLIHAMKARSHYLDLFQ
jgi:hypothetical protein